MTVTSNLAELTTGVIGGPGTNGFTAARAAVSGASYTVIVQGYGHPAEWGAASIPPEMAGVTPGTYLPGVVAERPPGTAIGVTAGARNWTPTFGTAALWVEESNSGSHWFALNDLWVGKQPVTFSTELAYLRLRWFAPNGLLQWWQVTTTQTV